MKLTILVPVYNEENTITFVLNKLISLKLKCDKEVIVIDDGSTDKTKSFIQKIKKYNLKKIFHKQNLGKGEALKSGIKKATGSYILIQDADLEYDPEEIPNLLKPIEKNKNTPSPKLLAIYGSRFKRKNVEIPPVYLFGNKLLTYITNLLFGVHLSDMETGFKLLPAAFLKKIKIKSSHFDFEPEITARLIKRKIPIIEVPISYKGRSHVAGKKLTVMDAFGAIKALIYFRFLLQ